MENYPNSEITILDRFGTAVLKKSSMEHLMERQFNGRILPTGTYWYVLKVSDGRKPLQGHVLIKIETKKEQKFLLFCFILR